MSVQDKIEISRDIVATTIPYGGEMPLAAGTLVGIVQRLGASITVQTQYGDLLRINGDDADALGLEPIENGSMPNDGPFEMSKVTDALNTIYDPEIPVSIVELGLVYRCDEVLLEDGKRRIEIDMAMTAPGCGMGDVLRNDAIQIVQLISGVDEVDVQIVWDPPWDISRMSDAAKLQLGMF